LARGGGGDILMQSIFGTWDGNYEYRKNRDKMKQLGAKDHPSITGIFFKILTMEIYGSSLETVWESNFHANCNIHTIRI
jgi:hypothetical protein